MLVLVTGAAGFLGSSVVERLIVHGQRNIRCLVRPGSRLSKLEALRAKYPEAVISYVTGNLVDARSASSAVAGVDIVYHLAAGTQGGYADMFVNSVVASRNLLDAVVAHGVRKVVVISSLGVYGVAGLPRGAKVTEQTPIEPYPEKRDAYSFAKIWQERLFHEYQKRAGFELVTLRPGVLFGPGGGGALPTRVGVQFPGFFMNCGGGNPLPLSYVENCAEAVAIAGSASHPSKDEVYNVLDDDLPTCGRYLREFRRNVDKVRSIRVPFFAVMALSRLSEWYSHHSKGQLPAFLATYKSASLWKGNRFDNSKIKSLGWKPLVPIDEGLRRAFEHLRTQRAQ